MSTLPSVVPLFPLQGCILLPENMLSLHVFEPRYRQMVQDALASNRMLGIIQPEPSGNDESSLSPIGTLGQVTEFKELEDGRFLIFIVGVSKFKLSKEISVEEKLYRSFQVSYLSEESLEEAIETVPENLLEELEYYCKLLLSKEEYEQKKELHPVTWINHLSQNYTFDPIEKQQLLEAPTVFARLEALVLFLKTHFAEKSFGDLDTIH